MPIYKAVITKVLLNDGWIDELYYSELETREQKVAWLESGSLVIRANDSLFGQYSELN